MSYLRTLFLSLLVSGLLRAYPSVADSVSASDVADERTQVETPAPSSQCTFTVNFNQHVYKGKDKEAVKKACEAKEDPIDCVLGDWDCRTTKTFGK